MNYYPFYTALSHLQDFHGIEMNEDEFENIAFHAYLKIGNKRTSMYTISGQTTNCRFELPCNTDIVEMVTTNGESYQDKRNVNKGNSINSILENRIERNTNEGDSMNYIPGKMIDYTQVDNVLIFKKDAHINVLYKGELLDDEGLPKISTRETEAIANYCAYTHLYKKGLASKDPATIQLANMIKQEWSRTCTNARSPEYLNQNDFDNILQAQHSWDRKRYNVSFKPLRK